MYTCNLTEAETLDELAEKIIEAYLDKPGGAPNVEWISINGEELPKDIVGIFNKTITDNFPYRQREFFDNQETRGHWARSLA